MIDHGAKVARLGLTGAPIQPPLIIFALRTTENNPVALARALTFMLVKIGSRVEIDINDVIHIIFLLG